MSVRGRWIGALAVLTVLIGTGRLTMNEVQLAGSDARARGLEQRADGAARDRYRLVRLEQEIEANHRQVADLDAKVRARAEEVTRLTSSVVTSRARLATVQGEAHTKQARMESALEESQQLSSELEHARKALEELAKSRAIALAAAEALASERALALAKSRAETREHEQTVARQRGELGRLRSNLKTAVGREERSKGVLARLESAGVNVARLSGERPMPMISAVVVRVDADAMPPRILIDVGRDSGLELRDTLYLIRDGRVVAELEVAEVGELISSAKITQGQRGLKLRAGEDVSSIRPRAGPP